MPKTRLRQSLRNKLKKTIKRSKLSKRGYVLFSIIYHVVAPLYYFILYYIILYYIILYYIILYYIILYYIILYYIILYYIILYYIPREEDSDTKLTGMLVVPFWVKNAVPFRVFSF